MAHIPYHVPGGHENHREVGLQYLSERLQDPNVMTEALVTHFTISLQLAE